MTANVIIFNLYILIPNIKTDLMPAILYNNNLTEPAERYDDLLNLFNNKNKFKCPRNISRLEPFPIKIIMESSGFRIIQPEYPSLDHLSKIMAPLLQLKIDEEIVDDVIDEECTNSKQIQEVVQEYGNSEVLLDLIGEYKLSEISEEIIGGIFELLLIQKICTDKIETKTALQTYITTLTGATNINICEIEMCSNKNAKDATRKWKIIIYTTLFSCLLLLMINIKSIREWISKKLENNDRISRAVRETAGILAPGPYRPALEWITTRFDQTSSNRQTNRRRSLSYTSSSDESIWRQERTQATVQMNRLENRNNRNRLQYILGPITFILAFAAVSISVTDPKTFQQTWCDIADNIREKVL